MTKVPGVNFSDQQSSSIEDIHVIGFSLGAHIAGYAGRELALRGIPLARITGLDPASPLFRENLRISLESLNPQDATLVDVIHTDGAAVWPAGFGLLKPVGHVDFFPNGGQGQPGCAQVRASVIVSHLEGTINSSVVCNHVRGFQLFLESIYPQSDCKFYAYPCPTRELFHSGVCFPQYCSKNITDDNVCGEMGYEADKSNSRGPLYLVTRDRAPFCGEQLQASIKLSKKTQRPPRGHLQLHLLHGQDTTVFTFISSDLREAVTTGRFLRSLSAARYGSISKSTPMSAVLMFSPMEPYRPLYLDRVRIADLHGHRWSYCGGKSQLIDRDGDGLDTSVVNLIYGDC